MTSLRQSLVLLIGAFLLTCFIVYANRDLFSSPIIEYSDFAANALQIQEAKSGRELLGNYSRFRFHHPGPFFFYVMAAGEALFYDATGLVPAPFNAEILSIILLNASLIAAALLIVLRHLPSRLYPPLAMAVCVWFFYTVNVTSFPSDALHGAMVSPWVPHLLLAPFVLLLVAAASTASGVIAHMPVLVLAASILVHGHVAQSMFAPVIVLSAVGLLCVRLRKAGELRRSLSVHRKTLALSAALIAVFAAPILIEAVIHEPDNLDAIRTHRALAQGNADHPSLRSALVYFGTFFAQAPSPEKTVPTPHPELLHVAFSRHYSRNFLLALLLSAACAAWLSWRLPKPSNTFVFCLAGAILLTSALFIVWALNITGGFYQFNGFFVFSLQLLVLLTAVAVIADRLDSFVKFHSVGLILTCLSSAAILLCSDQFRHHIGGVPLARTVAEALPRSGSPVRLEVPSWSLDILGVASWMKRDGIPFCVDPAWGFQFGGMNVCRVFPEKTLHIDKTGSTEPPASETHGTVYAGNGIRAALRSTRLQRPAELDATIAQKLDIGHSIVIYRAEELSGGHYVLRSADGLDVSLIQSNMPLRKSARYLIELMAHGPSVPNKPLIINLYADNYLRQSETIDVLPSEEAWQSVVIDSGPDAPETAAIRIYTQSTVPIYVSKVSVALLKVVK